GLVRACLSALFGAVAAFGIGTMVQSNSVADVTHSEWNISTWSTGLVLTLVAGVVLIGGIKWIGRVSAALVPFMVLLYCLGGVAVLAFNVGELPNALQIIFTDAFTGTPATGGFIGAGFLAALRYGVARGIFSNESGLGTGGIAAAAAKTTHEVRQALVSMTQTFLDTLVVVSFTGLAIVVTGAWTFVDEA